MNREMKHSGIAWIGDIPIGWDLERLQSQVVEINEKNSPLKTNYVLSLTIKDGVIPYEEKGDVGNKAKENHEDYKLAYPDTIVLNSMNILIGAVGICKYYGCVSPVYYVLKPTPKSDLRYLNYIMSSTPFQKYLRKYANGILEIRMRVSADDILKRHIPVPSLAEQKAIADFLDKKCEEIDELVALQEKIIEELKSYKQSVITETVCKGLNPNAPMKDSGVEWIGEIPEGWNLRYIKNVATFHNGDRGVNYPSGDDMVSDGIPFLTSNNLHQLLLDIEKYTCKYITLDRYNILGGVKIQLDDIIYCLRGSVGNCTLNKQITEGTVASSLMVIRPRYISPEYLNYYLHSHIVSAQTEVYMNGTCAANLSAENVSKFNIHIPPAEEQQEIADYLDKKCSEIDQLISIKQQKIVELKDYKKSLIYEYTTGKKEVKL